MYGKIAVNIRAFVTPLAPCLLYVSKQDNNGIVVESLDKKCESADFNWKVVGDRIDNVIGNSTLAPQDEVGNLSVAVDADLKEVIYRLPSDAEEEVVGYENILLENGSTKQKTITTKKPNKWEWIPKSKLKEHMKTYMEKSNTSP